MLSLIKAGSNILRQGGYQENMGEYFIDASSLNEAIMQGRVTIEEDPRYPGSFDVRVPD